MIVTKFTYDYKKHINQVDGVSMTIPDQTMSLRTLLDRYARGLPLGGNAKQAIYEGEDVDGVDLSTMDLAEREDYIQAKREELQQLTNKLQEQHNNAEAQKQAKIAEDNARTKKEADEAITAQKQANTALFANNKPDNT